MAGKSAGDLRPLLTKRLAAAEIEAVQNDGKVSEATLSEISRLVQIIDIREKSEPATARQRWPVALAFGLTLLLASVLLFVHVPQTAIDLQVTVYAVELRFAAARPWTDAMQLSSLGASGLDSVAGPPGLDMGARRSLKLDVAAGKQPGELTLAPIFLPAKSRVWLRSEGTQDTYRMSLKADDLQLRADVRGEVMISGKEGIQTLSSPQGFVMKAGSREAEVEFSLLTKAETSFAGHLPVDSIALSSVEEFNDGEQTMARRVSSVLSGVIYFEALSGRERKLRQGETVVIEPASGVLEKISCADGKITLEFHGIVRGLKTGDDEHTNLLPSCLEWLQARHGLSLMWGTAIYLLGLIMGVLRWAGARV